jgi:hypothetical protein
MKLKRLLATAVTACMLLSAASVMSGCSIGAEQTVEGVGNTCGNIANLGAVAEKDGKLYYQNSDDGLKIYCSDKNGKNPVKVNDNTSYFINTVDDWIVYANADDDFHIYKVHYDGSENTKLNDAMSYYVSVVDNEIYYSDWSNDFKLTKMSLDGTDSTVISEDKAYYVNVYDGRVYYSDYSSYATVCSVDLNGDDKRELTNAGCLYVVADGDWIYFSATKTTEDSETKGAGPLCRVKRDGSVTQMLVEGYCADINVYEDKVYYTDIEQKKICRANTDGTEQEVLADVDGMYLNAAYNKLYYLDYDADSDKDIEIKSIDIK